MLRRSPIVLLALSAACVSLPPPRAELPFESGSRLRARVDDGGDGAALFFGWHDVEIDLDCAFGVASDGETRCLPTGQRTAWLTSDDIVYTDAACRTAVRVAVASSGAPPRWIPGPTTTSGDTCAPSRTPIVELGSPIPFTSVSLSFLDHGVCRGLGTTDPAYVLYALGPEVPAATFVRATIADEPRSDRLSARVARADDGARQLLAPVDVRRAHECMIEDWIAPDRCCPSVVAWAIGEFADPACTIPSAYSSTFAPLGVGPGDCGPQPFLAVDPYGDCHARFYALDGLATGSWGGTPCESRASGTHLDWVRGAELPADDVPFVSRAPVGTGRLRVYVHAAENGAPLDADSFHDTALDADCSAVFVCDGTRRCVASSATLDESRLRWRDATCSGAPLAILPAGGCRGTPAFVRLLSDPSGCLGETDLHRTGAPLDAATPLFARDAEGTCLPSPPIDVASAVFAIGDVVPASSLATVITRTE